MLTSDHRKIIIEDSRLGDVAFADFYSFGEATRLVCWIGGSISRHEYLKRLKTEPVAIVTEYEKTRFADSPLPDLLVCSPPSSGQIGYDRIAGAFLSHFLFELLPNTNSPRPERISLVGYSYGAYLASFITSSLAAVKDLAVIGGCGMVDAIQAGPQTIIGEQRFISFENNDDGCGEECDRFEQYLWKQGVILERVRSIGGHSFANYVANGSVERALGVHGDNRHYHKKGISEQPRGTVEEFMRQCDEGKYSAPSKVLTPATPEEGARYQKERGERAKKEHAQMPPASPAQFVAQYERLNGKSTRNPVLTEPSDKLASVE